jgi:YbbR domain-containing protein
MNFSLVGFFTDNLAYKIVALLISLVLWMTILGRQDFVMSKTIEVDFLTSPGNVVVSQSSESVKVKVSGSRTALKKFMDSALSHSLSLDIASKGTGVVDVQIPLDKFDIPIGIKIIGVKPLVIRTEVQSVQVGK